MTTTTPALQFYPATEDRWPDLQELFGNSGGHAGCWCMFWRLPRRQFKQQKYEGNRMEMAHLLRRGVVPGLLAYQAQTLVGWCAISPREQMDALEASRLLKRVDDQPVWSITCFYVRKSHRRQQIMTQLLQAAVAYACEQGAGIVEGYPIEIEAQVTSPGGYMGFVRAFRSAGFVEVTQVSETQHIMRINCAHKKP
jgi:GNAT superfamily N-acetyltransferase